MHAPWWYHPATAAVAGSLIPLLAFGNAFTRFGAIVAVSAVSRLLDWGYRRATGVRKRWFSGTASTVIWIVWGVVMIALAFVTVVVHDRPAAAWIPWAATAVVLLGTLLVGFATDRVTRERPRVGGERPV